MKNQRNNNKSEIMKKGILLTLTCLMFTMMVEAQSKFGHINKQDLLMKMPAVTEAKKKLEVFGKQLEDQQNELKKELETKYTAYMTMREDPKVNKTIITTKEDELKGLQERLQKFQQTANEDFQKEQETQMKPIIDKVDVAIKGVATENKYSYIFDTSLGVVIYAAEGDDITALVKKKLGIK